MRTNVILPPFKPCWWLRNPHAQTIVATWFKPGKLPGETERVELKDGDFIDLVWYGEDQKNQPVVMILHGLEGGDNSHYVRSIVWTLVEAGFRVVFMFHRGCSHQHNRLARSYHSGETGDMAAVMKHVNTRTGKAAFAAVGYSLGANALLKYLGEQGTAARVHTAIAVSTPFDLYAACVNLDKGFSRLYQRHLITKLIRRYYDKFKNRSSPVYADVSSLRTFLEFDEYVTAAVNGFDGAIDYYTRSSCRQYLSAIEKPCLIIHAADDPFLPCSEIPDATELPDCVQLELLAHGGHVGFLDGGARPGRWLNKAILTFLNEQ